MTTTARYLIVGGGMTADAGVKGIREHDGEGAIVLVGEEQHPPYARPPLTKGLWQGSPEEKIWRGTAEAGADLRLRRRIASLDVEGRRATDDQGEDYAWEKLLLATGGRPRTLAESDGVVYYRTLDDFRGESRFTTWAYKFALLHAAVKVRRRAWEGRDLPLEPESWAELEHPAPTPAVRAERAALLEAIREGIESLTERQRLVLVALALNGVPIDVLAERLGSNRNALYKTLHDARRRFRAHLEERGLGGDLP